MQRQRWPTTNRPLGSPLARGAAFVLLLVTAAPGKNWIAVFCLHASETPSLNTIC